MRYNVYFVEDEYMLREYVKSNPIWRDGPYLLCGDAANGEDAWEEIQKLHVDILLTDIKMPFMDGLELSRLVRANRPEIKVVILSGYDDFSYAQQALSLGVTDYLVKPLKPDDLLKTLDRAAKMIDMERKQRKSLSALEELASESLELNRQRFLSQLCCGFLPLPIIETKCRQLHLNLSASCYVGCILQIQEFGRAETEEESYLTFVDCSSAIRAYAQERKGCFWYSEGVNQFRFLLLGEEANMLEEADRFFASLQELLQQQFHLSKIWAVIGAPCLQISELYTSMLSAQVAVSLLPQTAHGEVVRAAACGQSFTNAQYTSAEKELFRSLLATGTVKDVPNFVASMTEKLEQENLSHLYLSYVCLDILSAVTDFAHELGCAAQDIPDFSIPNVMQLFDCGQDLSGFQNALREMAIQAINLRDQSRGGKNNDMICQAKMYIQQHYNDPELDLSAVSQQINMNATYFSALFKRETGQCFIEYLTFLRMTRAKELLKATQKRTSDIAFEVGYNDQNYFSKLFKKYTGTSAREFRQVD